MKITRMILLILSLLLMTACSGVEKQSVKTDVNETNSSSTGNSFPHTTSRPSDSVVCHNCQASFKMSSARQKTTHGHSYIECPVCHENYLKKLNRR